LKNAALRGREYGICASRKDPRPGSRRRLQIQRQSQADRDLPDASILWLSFEATREHRRPTSQATVALSRRAYAIYIIHPPVLVAIALAWRNIEAPHLVKSALTGALTSLACFWIAGVLLRVPPIRRIV
jgi:hypothetical protein